MENFLKWFIEFTFSSIWSFIGMLFLITSLSGLIRSIIPKIEINKKVNKKD